MNNLEAEKLNALQTTQSNDHNDKYNLTEQQLKSVREAISGQLHKEGLIPSDNNIKSVDGIKTRKKSTRKYNKIWNIFLKKYSKEFQNYMGYTVAQITHIGFKQFIDYMDWDNESDIKKYKTDKVKVLPCQHCHKHFTTFQLDYGLCDKCKCNYDIKKFESHCNAIDAVDPGSSPSLIMAFTYFKDFRKMFDISLSFGEKVKISIIEDELTGAFSEDLLISVAGDKYKEDEFFSLSRGLPMTTITLGKLTSIQNIFDADCTADQKISRIHSIFKTT